MDYLSPVPAGNGDPETAAVDAGRTRPAKLVTTGPADTLPHTPADFKKHFSCPGKILTLLRSILHTSVLLKILAQPLKTLVKSNTSDCVHPLNAAKY